MTAAVEIDRHLTCTKSLAVLRQNAASTAAARTGRWICA